MRLVEIFSTLCRILVLSLSLVAMNHSLASEDKDWPSKPLKFVVPYVAGGGADITVRNLGQLLAASLGQTVLVENKAGGGGTIGTDLVAKAAPDGYTFGLINTGPVAISPYLYKSLPFDPLKDLAPVSRVADAPLILTVHSSLPVNNLTELIAYLKANPNKIFYGSAGTGSAGHLGVELFMSQTDTRMTHIPFKGGAQAVIEMVAGRTQMELLTVPGGLSHKLRALAMVAEQRFPLLPEVPTMAEAGMKDFDITNWYGIAAPAGTSPHIITRMNHALHEALKDVALRARFQDVGLVPVSNTPEEFAAFIRRESEKWQHIIKISGAVSE